MGLSFYTGQKPLVNATPAVSINRHGQIQLNTAAGEMVGTSYKLCIVGYDSDTNHVVVKYVTETASGVYHVKQDSDNRKRQVITCKRFFTWAGIDTSELKRFPVTYDAVKRLLRIDLNNPIS